MRTRVGILAGAGMIGVATWWYLSGGTGRPEPGYPSARDAPGAKAEKKGKYFHRRAGVQIAEPGPPEPSTPTLVAAPPVPDVVPPPSEAVDQVAYVDSVFRGEVLDADWARSMDLELAGELRERAGTSSVDSFECRRTLCKARVSHLDDAEYQGFIARTFSPPALWKGAAMALRDSASDDGRVHATLFFARVGENLPILEE